MAKSISAFFPALNEEDNVAKLTEDLLQVLSANFEHYEVIIINDGSTDRTKQIADALCEKNEGHVRAIHRDKSTGYGNALKLGLMQHSMILSFLRMESFQGLGYCQLYTFWWICRNDCKQKNWKR